MFTLITGASSGIGKELARVFAENGHNLIITARNENALTDLAQNLTQKHNIEVKTFITDLSNIEGAFSLANFIKENNYLINILVNNAGFGDFELLHNADENKIIRMINLNITALTYLSQFASRLMIENNIKGKILNVASFAAFIPIPRLAVYAATKSFVYSFSAAIRAELKNKGIQVSVLCPGPVATNFAKTANFVNYSKFNFNSINPEYVAKYTFNKFNKGKFLIIPELKFRIAYLFLPLIPKKLVISLSKKMFD